MKPSCYIFIGITMACVITVLPNIAFARGGGYHAPKLSHEFKIKVLKDSTLALQQSRPDLAQKLNDYANEEMSGIIEKNKEDRKIKIRLLQDSEAALGQSNPDLAKELKKIEEEVRKGPGILGELLGM